MRCLHCDKKLSLLKLAKGDSFCSSAHFDAYQLQLSKSAYDRLLSVPDDDVPKPPLVFKPVDADATELEADSALARLAAFRAPEHDEPAAKAPPYASFLKSPLPSFPPHVELPVSGEADAHEPVEAARGVTLPVHQEQDTTCILNLYLRLGLSETPPMDWARELETIAMPEDFPGEITRPEMEASSEAEPIVQEVVENQAEPVENPAQAVEIHRMEPAAPVETPPAPVRSEAPQAKSMPPQPRLPFLVAPSFRERAGEDIPFDAAASSVPQGRVPAPVLHPVQLPGAGWAGRIRQSASFAEAALTPREAAGKSIESGFATPAAVTVQVPGNGAIGVLAWEASHGSTGIARPPLETKQIHTDAVDYTPPVPAPVRPTATLTPNLDRGQVLTAACSAKALARKVLKTEEQGRQATLVPWQANAMEYGLREILAPFPAREPFSASTWQNQAAPFSLSTSTADGMKAAEFPSEWLEHAVGCIKQGYIRPDGGVEHVPVLSQLARFPLQWRVTSAAVLPRTDPAPADAAPAIGFLAPHVALNRPMLMASTMIGTPFERAFLVAPGGEFERPVFASTASTRLPAAARVNMESKIGVCALTANWNPSAPAASSVPVAKFLPARKSPILPAARSWPRLGAPAL